MFGAKPMRPRNPMNIITKPTNPEVTTALKNACDQRPTLWEKIVLRKWLFVAIGVHVVFALIAMIWIVAGKQNPRKQFMAPIGGKLDPTKEPDITMKLGSIQNRMSAPEQPKRVTTSLATVSVALPDMPEMLNSATDLFPGRDFGFSGTGPGTGPTGPKIGGGPGDGSGISLFNLRVRAKSIVLLVDVSDSMVMDLARPAPKPGIPARTQPVKGIKTYAALEDEMKRVIGSLEPGVSFSVVCFAGDVEPYKTSLVPANEGEKDRAIRFIQAHSPALNAVADRREKERTAVGFKPASGSANSATHFNHAATRTMAALDFAFKMNPDAICLVSDGAPTDGGFGGVEILTKIQAMQKALPRPIAISVVAYLADGGQKFMSELAAQNRGAFKEVLPNMSSFGF